MGENLFPIGITTRGPTLREPLKFSMSLLVIKLREQQVLMEILTFGPLITRNSSLYNARSEQVYLDAKRY